MQSFKSMIFGSSKPQAVKWLGMNASDENGTTNMFIHADTFQEILEPLEDSLINLVAIFGAARQGKSFLMNLLANQQDLFKISNLREPCTQGVDLSAHFVPLEEFSSFNSCRKVHSSTSQKIMVGFADAEGQGDRDISYDSKLVSPVLLASKVVIFNWKDSLQADRILNLLAVLARAAQGVKLGSGDQSKVFGHLHIVFRDWSFVDSTPKEVFNDLFKNERGHSQETSVRNLARLSLTEAFETIHIWLFPAPVANTSILREKIRFEQLQKPFQEKLREFRMCLSDQLRKPMLFNQRPLTATLLTKVVPTLVDNLNKEQLIMPESIFSSLVRAEAKCLQDTCEQKISAHCESLSIEEVVATHVFEKMLHQDIQRIISGAIQGMDGAPSTVKKDIEDALWKFAEKEIQIALHVNNEKIAAKVSTAIDETFGNLQKECKYIEQDLIPMKEPLLKKKCNSLLERELHRLNTLPIASNAAKIQIELDRLKQHASILFDKLEVANERAVQRANASMNEHVRAAKAQMTKEINTNLEERFAQKTPVTVSAFQAELEDLYLRSVRFVKQQSKSAPFVTSDFIEELEEHKSHLAEAINRRYMVEMRQILNDIGFAAKQKLNEVVAQRLDGKLPLENDEIKKEIDDALQQIKVDISQKLQGWTILRCDIATKSAELEHLGDMHAEKYLEQNTLKQRELQLRLEQQQYVDLKKELEIKFRLEMAKITLPVDASTIDGIFASLVKTQISKLIAMNAAPSSFNEITLGEKLKSDCSAVLESQKEFNMLAVEKKKALEQAEQERARSESERALLLDKDAEMRQLREDAERYKSTLEEESGRLRHKLREEAEHSRRLRREIEAIHEKSLEKEDVLMEQVHSPIAPLPVIPESSEANDIVQSENNHKKRKVTEIETEDVHPTQDIPSSAEHTPHKQTKQGKRKKTPTSASKAHKLANKTQKLSLSEARKAAQLEVENRTKARAKSLTSSANKKRK